LEKAGDGPGAHHVGADCRFGLFQPSLSTLMIRISSFVDLDNFHDHFRGVNTGIADQLEMRR